MWYGIIAVFIVIIIVAPSSALVGVIVKKVVDRQTLIPDVIETNRDEFIAIDPMPAEDVLAPSNQTKLTLASGENHTCVVVYSGHVMCWGANDSGQLGFGSDGSALPFATTANVVSALEQVQMVAVGEKHSCALVAPEGTVWCWGNNDNQQIGQLSAGPQTSTAYPQRIAALDRIRQIAAGANHTCALRADGTVWCWGDNRFGQLGRGDVRPAGGVLQVIQDEAVLSVAVGADTSCMRGVSGTLACWGGFAPGGAATNPLPRVIDEAALTTDAVVVINAAQFCAFTVQQGALCWSTTGGSAQSIADTAGALLIRALRSGVVCATFTDGLRCWEPNAQVQQSSEKGIVDITGGASFDCIALRAGRVRCRGQNTLGQLASAGSTNSESYVSVQLGNSASLLSAGANHVCGMWQLGMLRCWGRAYEGQLGVSDTIGIRSQPEPVTSDMNGIQAVATGSNHTCALRLDGTVACWGANESGQLGTGDTLDRAVPALVPALTDGIALSAGASHSCLLQRNGTVWCWGDNRSMQIGSEQSYSATPQRVENLQSLVAIASGGDANCGLQADGLVTCWGAQIGQSTPFAPIAALTDTTSVVVGKRFVCALRIDGSVWCWGDAEGVGASPTPQQVASLPLIRTIRAGGQHMCAIDERRHLWCWGANQLGQVDPSTTASPILVPLDRAQNVAAVATGFATTCMRNVSGTTNCWGDNRYGQLADADASMQVATVNGYDDGFSIAAGGNFSCAMLKYVSVRCWGSNENGQLGDGTTTASAEPQTVRSNEEVLSIATGSAHACQIIIDGTVRCWGHNNFGQLGNEATEDSATPVVAALQSVVALSLGQSHSCALLQDGGGACWGRNDDGQLGSGNTASSGMPLRVADLQDAIAIASGGNHTCAITQNTSVVCWGRNEQGQLGIGSVGPGISVPAAVPNLVGVTALAAGNDHTCALREDGSVWCWGWNRFGQIGVSVIGEKAFSLTAVPIRELRDVISVQAGGNHSCALMRSGIVRCWGDNYNGQLGVFAENGATFDSLGRDIVGLDSAIQIATGGAHTCALQQRGNVRCWGWNRDGQLGTGTRMLRINTDQPTPIVGQTNITAIAVGDSHLCDVDTAGTVWCWGDNDVGQLGIGVMGNVGDLGLPNEVDAAVNTVSVDLGARHSCALLVTNELNCWGRNSLGQLGNSYAGDIADSVVPNFVVGMTNVTAYSAGGDTSCAVSQGLVSCWGDNEYGQLAAPTVGIGDYRTTATEVAGIDSVIDVSVGRHHVCALREDRSVWCWGRNNAHQINDTEAALVIQPALIPLSKPIANIDTSADHTCALDTEGTIWCWGNNQSGQLSVVGESIRTVQKVDGIPPAASLVTGDQHSCALDKSGTVWCWGNNEQGQMGVPIGAEAVNLPPMQVANLSGVRTIAAGGERTCALRNSGEVWCWGENETGQLGVSPNPNRHVPAIVMKLWSMRLSTYQPLVLTPLPTLPTIVPSVTAVPTMTRIPTRTLIRVVP